MLNDLTGRNVPVLTLDDFNGLSDACPSEPDYEQVRWLGLPCELPRGWRWPFSRGCGRWA